MSLLPGARLGSYEILGKLGEGGMGEVYRARDAKLRREVAIKVLSPHLVTDSDHVARLGREARLLASLNHPYIATIHGLEESDGVRAIVLELVEGPTLAEKLEQRALEVTPGLPIADALKISGQIAEGLEAAHHKGIVHRDLKPANVKLTRDGTVRLLDFGIATTVAGNHAGVGVSQVATLTANELEAGTLLGTPAYMSPQQLRGQAVDRQADIWAFGCVLFEMLAGRRPFPAPTITDLIAAILEREPEWSALPPQTPPTIRQLLRRCLEKDPNRRLHDIADARIEIDDARSGAGDVPAPAVAPPATPARPGFTAALIVAALLVGAAAVWTLRPASVPQPIRLELNTPPTRDASVALSPDGRTIAYVVSAAGGPQLWLRRLDSASPRVLAGTQHATRPFWSADGRAIGFFAGVRLMWIEIDGGTIHTLTTRSGVPLGGTWNRDGVILFADNPGGPINRIPATGGEPVAVTVVDPQQRGHQFPVFLPGGRRFIYYVNAPGPEARGVYVGDLDGGATKRLLAADGPAVYASGHLFFKREGKLFAQRFDGTDNVDGEASAVDDVLPGPLQISVADSGTVAWRTGAPEAGTRQLVWLDRSGRELDKVVFSDTAASGPAISPDGRRLAVYRFVDGNMDIWSYDLRRRTWDRLTFDPGDDIYPLWSPDATRIIYAGARTHSSRNLQIFRHVLGAAPADEEVLVAGEGGFPLDWSRDGKFLLYGHPGPRTGADLFAMRVDGDRTPFAVVQTEFSEGLAVFSPDAKWIAYESDKSGRLEVYLRPFPGPGPDVRASTDGGSQARWNPMGSELFYVAEDDQMMAVTIAVSPDGRTVEPGKPVALFPTNIGSTATLKYRQQYVLSPDGKSFILQSVVGQGSASPISLILSWKR